MRSSAIFLVRVVTSTRCPASERRWICSSRSSIWPRVGFTTTSGSTRPVGRMICSTTCAECSSSQRAGVAERNTAWRVRSSHSSKRSGRLSAAEGSRKPCSTSTALRLRSPSDWPCSCGMVTWLSSTTVRKSSGK